MESGIIIKKHHLTKREIEVLYIYNNFNRKNKHKMVDIPIFKLNLNKR